MVLVCELCAGKLTAWHVLENGANGRIMETHFSCEGCGRIDGPVKEAA